MKYTTNLLLNEFEIPENPTCLDVACGTGVSTFELIKHCGSKGKFYGIDISRNSLEVAQEAALRDGVENVDFVYGDAERIEFPDNFFDLVLCNMSLHFFPDKPKALREMCRVLKPGGWWALTYAGKSGWQEMTKIALEVVARHPDLPSFRDAVNDTSNWPLGLEESFDLLEEAGLRITNIYERRSINYADPSIIVAESNSAWDYWRQEIPESMINIIREELLDGARKDASSRGFKFTMINIFAWGTKL
jgi:ubiquinone/menaquinone biosynthesis C-methylase UbiE